MTTEEQNLFGKSDLSVFETYGALKAMLAEFCNVVYEFKKTSIHCKKNVGFLGIHPKKKCLDLNIVLSRSMAGLVPCTVEQVSAHRFHNEIRISDQAELGSIKEYLKESYDSSK